jgi:divalent metal cation (Fe/Co/Zn/Cd) transporter
LVALKVKGIQGVHRVEVRKLGADTSVNLHLELDPKLTVKQAHDLVEQFERNAKSQLPIDEINTHIETLSSEVTVSEDLTESYASTVQRIKAIIATYPQIKGCHRISVRRSEGKVSLNMACVLQDEESLAHAHEVCNELEAAIRSEFSELTDIHIHVDPRTVDKRDPIKPPPSANTRLVKFR